LRSDEYARAIVGQVLRTTAATTPTATEWMAELNQLMTDALAADARGLVFELGVAAGAGFRLAAEGRAEDPSSTYARWALEQAEGNDLGEES